MRFNKEKLKKTGQFLFNPKLILCFGIGWMITNGWSYILGILGVWLRIQWMTELSLAYLTILWFPFTPEKLITVSIAIFLLKKLFPNDERTLAVLKKLHKKILAKGKAKKAEKNKSKEV